MKAASTKDSSLICDYLGALGVPFTRAYADGRVSTMPFKSLFGLMKVMEDYGVTSRGYRLDDKDEIHGLSVPFLAVTKGGPVVVTAVGAQVEYLSDGVSEQMSIEDFKQAWTGDVMLSFPAENASEPDYGFHARIEFFNRAKKWVFAGGLALIFLWLFISGELWRDVSAWFVAAFDIAGLYFTFLLVQKSLNIRSGAADKVCGVLQEGGCDKILELPASKFFGLFGWSEVGFAYFSVSLLAMLLFPESMGLLAIINLCCLPFTFWSIWYQRFRAHHWCTLCVSVQAMLWMLFFSYLAGGWISTEWPPTVGIIALGVSYLTVMLGINLLMPLIKKNTDEEAEN